jgi:hypothetical protein
VRLRAGTESCGRRRSPIRLAGFAYIAHSQFSNTGEAMDEHWKTKSVRDGDKPRSGREPPFPTISVQSLLMSSKDVKEVMVFKQS